MFLPILWAPATKERYTSAIAETWEPAAPGTCLWLPWALLNQARMNTLGAKPIMERHEKSPWTKRKNIL